MPWSSLWRRSARCIRFFSSAGIYGYGFAHRFGQARKTVKTITGSDGKTYTIVDDSDLNAESAALSYACSIAHNSLAFFSDDNDVIYLNAMKQYKSGSENAADVKIKSVKKSLTVSNQSSQIFLSYKSTLKDPEKCSVA